MFGSIEHIESDIIAFLAGNTRRDHEPQAQPAPVSQVKADDQATEQQQAPAPQAKQEPKPLKPKDEQAEADAMIDAILADMEKAQDETSNEGGAQ